MDKEKEKIDKRHFNKGRKPLENENRKRGYIYYSTSREVKACGGRDLIRQAIEKLVTEHAAARINGETLSFADFISAYKFKSAN